MTRKTAPKYYVGIGASAGGLDAIEQFFTSMPPDSGVAFIVIQHLSPDYKSLMVELLSKKSSMHVYRAEDNLAVEANCIYLIPPRKNMTIFHGKLLLSDQESQPRGINFPIDIFLKSLAEDQGDKAIAIILSGTGSDGMKGVMAVKEKGGMIMVQTEESAKFDGMPNRAISTGMADYILPPESMPGELLSFIKHPYMTKTAKKESPLNGEDDLTRIYAHLRTKSKVDFTCYKPATVLRRIERRMTICQTVDIREYVTYLETSPVEWTNLYRDLLIGVTNFFRDPEAFALLAREVDELVENHEGDELRVWSAGCSTGEEAYSLAIIFNEALEKSGKRKPLKIFATDLDRDALVVASSGIYPKSIIADMPQDILFKYFTITGDDYQIIRPVREMVVFARHNLLKDPPFTKIDLVSCRNLLIYIENDHQQAIMNYFNFSLQPGGILFLGSSESIGDQAEYFEVIDAKAKLYRIRGKVRRLGVASHGDMSFIADARDGSRRINRNTFVRIQEEERLLDRYLQMVTDNYLPMSVLVNENLEMLHIFGDNSKRFFSVPMGKMTNDITRMVVSELSIPLATGLQRVFQGGKEVLYSNIRVNLEQTQYNLTMRIKKLPEKKGQESIAAVFLEEIRPVEKKSIDEIPVFDMDQEIQQRINDLEMELQFSRENLQATIEELETSNEELQATNEELLASNEELQSTNEELQSVNEELFTVNSEHQSKIAELTDLNNDLENLMAVFPTSTIFLDEKKIIRRYTAIAGSIYNIRESDIGRDIGDLSHRVVGVDPLSLINRGLELMKPVEDHILTDNGKWYTMKVSPYRIGPRSYMGVVVTFDEITEMKKYQLEMDIYRERINLAQKAARTGFWDWEIESGRLYWSSNTENLFGITPGSFDGTYEMFLSCVHPDDRSALSLAIEGAVKGEVTYENVRHRIVMPDGTIRWMEETGTVLRDDSGKAVRMIGIVKDITRHLDMERQIEDHERLHERLFNDSQIGIAFIDRAGKILTANAKLHEIVNREPGSLVKKDFEAIIHPADAKSSHDRLALLLDGAPGPFAVTERLINHQGDPVWCELFYSTMSERSDRRYVIVMVREISDPLSLDDRLLAGKAYIQNILDVSNEIIVVIGIDEKVLLVNRAGAEILGCRDLSLIGKNWFDEMVLPEEREEMRRLFQSAVQGTVRFAEHHENRIRTCPGDVISVAWHNHTFTDHNGAVIGTISSGRRV